MSLQSILITVTTIGVDAQLFTLSDDFGVIATNVTASELLSGYATQCDSTATQITVQSDSPCSSSLVIPITVLTPTPTTTATPTLTTTPTATVGSSPEPTTTPTQTPTMTSSVTPSPTVSITPTMTNSSTPTPSITTTPTATVGTSPEPTTTPTQTPTTTASQTPTQTPTTTETPTQTITQTPTQTLTQTPSATPTLTPALNLCILSSTTVTTSGSTSCIGSNDETTTYVFELTDLLGNPTTSTSNVYIQLDGTSTLCGASSTPLTVPLTIPAGSSYVVYTFYSVFYDSSLPCSCGFDSLNFSLFAIVPPYPPNSTVNFCGTIAPTPQPTSTPTATHQVSSYSLSYSGISQLDACTNLNGSIGTPATYYIIGYPAIGQTVYVDSFASTPLLGVNAVTLNGDAWGLDPLNGQINAPSIVC